MIHSHQIFTILVVLTSNFCFGYPNSSQENGVRSDGMVNIGGVLYPEEDLKNTEYRIKIENLAKRIKESKESDKRLRDYSKVPTDELLKMTLGTMNNINWDAGLLELSKRPDETKHEIDKLLSIETEYFEAASLFFPRLPMLAKIFGTEYQIEITKRVINHPLSIKHYNEFLLSVPYKIGSVSIIENLALSRKDETPFLDHLIEEGRIERGSELELKWRKMFSVGSREEKNRPEKSGLGNAPTHDHEAGEIPMGKADSESSSDSSYLVLGGVIVLLGILALLFKVWKGKSAR